MQTFHRPCFRNHFQVEVAGPDSILLLAENENILLQGRMYRILAPLLDGRHTVEELITQVAGELSAAEVHYGIGRLQQTGYLCEANPDAPAAADAYWNALGVDYRHAQHQLGKQSVRVRSLDGLSASPMLEALRAQGIRVDEGEATLTLVLVDDYLRTPLAELNQEALRTGRPWLLCKPMGKVSWLGPHFTPGQTACWECLAQRLRANRPIESFVHRGRPGLPPLRPARAALESTLLATAHLLASQVARHLVTGDNGLAHTLVTLDTKSLSTQRHTVTRRPQCPACGDPEMLARRQERPIVLASQPKESILDGGHRRNTPEQMLQRYQHHISPITGVVSHLERIDPLGSPTPVIDSGPNLSRPSQTLSILKHSFRSRSGGKGSTEVQARASGLAEGLERHSGVFHGDEARRRATLAELGAEAIPPHRWLNFSERQYREHETLNTTRVWPSRRVPQPLQPDQLIDWSPAWSLTHGVRRYLPTALCYFGYQDEGVPSFGWADSNGCAAGSCLEEAILQGFLELVERDSVALWWYNRLRRPGVELDSFNEPYFHQLRSHYAKRGREFWVLDITSDLGIPSFAAVSRRRGPRESLMLGFGTHLDPRIGILRALTEMNQFLPYELSETHSPLEGDEAEQWLTTATLAEHPYLAASESERPRTQGDPGRPWSKDLREDVEMCVRLASERGLEMLVLDQTRPDLELNVVRVVVPGLRHFWRRMGPGRLYDVPVQQGWLAQPTPEADMNPVEIFF
jgi:ribosomal protein S12 methylthiotransferase accessory factor